MLHEQLRRPSHHLSGDISLDDASPSSDFAVSASDSYDYATASDDSDDESDDSDEGNDADTDPANSINIKGTVNMNEIMATATKKRQSKAERLERVLEGRTAFEAKQRGAGSTNVEKLRRKNFLMSKLSKLTRSKGRGKPDLQMKRKDMPMKGSRDARKRRRRM